MSGTQKWLKPGDKVVCVCVSSISGSEVSRRPMTVIKVTKAGFIYVDKDRRSKFYKGARDDRWPKHMTRDDVFSSYRLWLERPANE